VRTLYPLHFLQGRTNYVLCWMYDALRSSSAHTASILQTHYCVIKSHFSLNSKYEPEPSLHEIRICNALQNLIMCKIRENVADFAVHLTLRSHCTVCIFRLLKMAKRTASLIKLCSFMGITRNHEIKSRAISMQKQE